MKRFIRVIDNYIELDGEETLLTGEMVNDELIRVSDLIKVYKYRCNTPVIAYLFRCRGINKKRIFYQAFKSYKERDCYFNKLQSQLTGDEK